jgi:hypothetical protein
VGSEGGSQRGDNPVGEALGPAVAAGAGQAHYIFAGCCGELGLGGPALEQSQQGRRAQVVCGQDQRRWVGQLQIGAQPVEQPALVADGAVVIAGDGAQLRTDRPVRDECFEPSVAVQGQQAADPGVFSVVFFARWSPPPRHDVGVDRHDGEPRIDQRLDQQPMAGFQHDAHLGWIGFQLQTPPDQAVDSGWTVINPELLDHPLSAVPRVMS